LAKVNGPLADNVRLSPELFCTVIDSPGVRP
jgi:hypothetical protein